MDAYKLRIKVGSHEFEAEGDKTTVMAQYESWKKLIESFAQRTLSAGSTVLEGKDKKEDIPEELTPLFETDQKRGLVTLRALPDGEQKHGDALLLVLYGYRRLRAQDEVLVTKIKSALETSGPAPGRIDRVAEPYQRDGLLVKRGARNASKYRLTNKGIIRAEELAKHLMDKLM
jgi:hypothetical protein